MNSRAWLALAANVCLVCVIFARRRRDMRWALAWALSSIISVPIMVWLDANASAGMFNEAWRAKDLAQTFCETMTFLCLIFAERYRLWDILPIAAMGLHLELKLSEYWSVLPDSDALATSLLLVRQRMNIAVIASLCFVAYIRRSPSRAQEKDMTKSSIIAKLSDKGWSKEEIADLLEDLGIGGAQTQDEPGDDDGIDPKHPHP